MSPYALRQRMRHGNVYRRDRTRIALDRFFTESNLTALRELSLRFVAGRVDAQLEGIGIELGRSQSVSERVLVLVDDVARDAAGAAPGGSHCGCPARAVPRPRRRDTGRRRGTIRAGASPPRVPRRRDGPGSRDPHGRGLGPGGRARRRRRGTAGDAPDHAAPRDEHARARAQDAARRADPRAAARRSRSRSWPTPARPPMPTRSAAATDMPVADLAVARTARRPVLVLAGIPKYG